LKENDVEINNPSEKQFEKVNLSNNRTFSEWTNPPQRVTISCMESTSDSRFDPNAGQMRLDAAHEVLRAMFFSMMWLGFSCCLTSLARHGTDR
jgi:hypothetical protein